MAEPRRVVWITGAGRGIGRSTALAFAQEGYDLALSARTASELENVANDARTHGGRAIAVPCDVTVASEVRRAHSEVTRALGQVTVLVNGAGKARSAPFLKSDEALFRSLWELNVMGVVHCTQAVLPAMLAGAWGRVINVASVAGKAGAPYIAAYAATKHAVLGITRSLAQETASKGVTVNAVCPGYVDTPMTEENVRIMVEKTGRPREEILTKIRAQSPQNRMMTPEEVAEVIVFLTRGGATGINGQAITIDGGGVQW